MRYFDEGGTRAAWVVHRRSGKDLTTLHQEAKMMHSRVGVYWHMLPTFEHARRAIWNGFRSDGKRILDNAFPPQIVRRRSEQQMLIETHNGSILQFVGSDNFNTLVGSNPVHVTFSEFALNHPSAWDYVRPILQENKGTAAFIFTPRGRNHAFDLFQTSLTAPGWFSRKLSIFDTKALDPRVLDEERAAGMPDALIRQEYLCDFNAALVGSVYGDLIEVCELAHAITDEPASSFPTTDIITVWDLGRSDATAIWFMHASPSAITFVDYYEASGKPLSHFYSVLESKPYTYARHFLPHDARAHTLASDLSVLEQTVHRFGRNKVGLVPNLRLADGIAAARWLLQQPTRFHATRCATGLSALRQYHYDFDAETKSMSTNPVHDFSSHGADAFRYASLVTKISMRISPKPQKSQPVPDYVTPYTAKFTLDQLFADRDASLAADARHRKL